MHAVNTMQNCGTYTRARHVDLHYVGSYAFSDDGSLMAYARGDRGSDWRTVYIIDVATGNQLEDRLQHAKQVNVSQEEFSPISNTRCLAMGGTFAERYCSLVPE